jgi:hypothetical protein
LQATNPSSAFKRTGRDSCPVGIFLTQIGASNVTANGINSAGQVVGNYIDAYGSHGYVELNQELYKTIDFPGANATVATAINDSGVTVGYYVTGMTFHGFTAVPGTLTTLDYPGSTFTKIFGINNAGQISGTYSGGDCSDGYCGFVYLRGAFTKITAPGASLTFVYGISNAGVVVGQYYTQSEIHGFTETDGVFTDIDVPDACFGTTIVMDANSSGTLVGQDAITVPATFGGSITLGFVRKP